LPAGVDRLTLSHNWGQIVPGRRRLAICGLRAVWGNSFDVVRMAVFENHGDRGRPVACNGRCHVFRAPRGGWLVGSSADAHADANPDADPFTRANDD
jgi:hypothetical protein